jgi:NAD(P)-dependent dehydrogenase (short-subunit alcohol dehydrogenase family)
VTSSWTARYPDLTGKAVVVAGDSGQIVEVVRALAANGALLAIVAENHAIVDSAVAVAEALEAAVLGMTADPASAAVWERVAPHIEQRLAPIDVAVALGAVSLRRAVTAALLPDMTARHRGVLIEVDTQVSGMQTPAGVRHRAIQTAQAGADADVAATVLLCASDSVAVRSMSVVLG